MHESVVDARVALKLISNVIGGRGRVHFHFSSVKTEAAYFSEASFHQDGRHSE
jgi:hypothetical protein